ncbi:unnamed protein product [Pelagomonas calceolata]|uniref:Fe2OG dioxygenase domain-containing protein n=1 Tax=Pelagomonas calceolata TaxID=35677 RepID=A0A7S4EE52_9STRA|nr:unnamed protein product [Pelagomonas calceolata]|mmetsp:Transcript_18598/g.57444  ORF Transcript_18598/g.57444 Transcript_18598/m.57444 type:complete len:237 (+) Transcript_18598:289-999(+)
MLPALCIALATRLATDGVAKVDGVLPAALAADVRAVALASAVPAQRQEVPLSLKNDAVASAAAAVALSPVGAALEELCGGDAPLFDLCAVISAPGAAIQPLHSDLGFDGAEAAPLYTCFVALQETPSALGPTEFCLGSHTDAAAHNSLRAGALSREAVPFPLAVGAAVLFDPRIAHRGGPNSSNRRRAYLSMTFANPRGSAPVIVPAPGDVLVSEGGISADDGGVWTLRELGALHP